MKTSFILKSVNTPFESESHKEVLKSNKEMTLQRLCDKANDIQCRCEDTKLLSVTTDTVYYDSFGDHLSFQTDDGLFHTVLSEHSKSQLCNRVGVPVRFLNKLQEGGFHELASDNINTMIQSAQNEYLLRMYSNKGIDYTRGVLTPSYSPFDTTEVLENFINSIKGTELSDYVVKDYLVTPERFHLRLIGEKLDVPGEDLFSGIQIDSSDVGKSRLSAKYLIYKLVCSNGLTVAKRDFTLFEQVHRGIDGLSFRERFSKNLERLPDLVAFSENTIMSAVDDSEGYDVNSMDEEETKDFMERIKSKTQLPYTGLMKVVQLMTTDYPPTRWGLINSITEVAQEFTLTRRLELEKIAGICYLPVSLIDRIIEDLKEVFHDCVSLPPIVLKPFSKTMYACYRVKTGKVYLYVFKDVDKKKCYDYEHYLTQAIHEVCHYEQYQNLLWERKKGIMHDTKFWEMMKGYTEKARELNLFEREVVSKNGKIYAS